MRIRPASPADESELQILDRSTWSPASSPAPPPPAGRGFFGPQRAPEDVLVAIVDGALVGYVRLAHPTPLQSNRHVFELRGLAVDPSRQRCGLGRVLVDAAVREAAARVGRRLTLRVLAPNAAARHLYERAGFQVEGVLREEFLLDGRYVDDMLMALELVPGTGDRSPERLARQRPAGVQPLVQGLHTPAVVAGGEQHDRAAAVDRRAVLEADLGDIDV